MKILYCIPALHNAGGMERVLSVKVNYLANLPDYNIYIVTTDHRKNQEIRFSLDNRIKIIHLDIDFVSHYDVPIFQKYFLHKSKLSIYKNKLRNIIQDLNIDVCVSLCGKEIDFLSKLKVNCKKVAEIHYPLNNRKQFLTARHSGIFWRILGSFRTYQLKNSVKGLDKFIVLTNEDKKQWNKYSKNVTLIHNPNPLKNNLVSSLNFQKVITVGRLEAEKGYDMLIDAWLLVTKKHPNWILDIYGEGKCRKDLETQITTKNLQINVQLCGLTLDIQSKYLESSFFVMSSLYEGLPMALIEAMSCGLPLVSFDCEYGPRELITDGVNGFLVQPNDIGSLAKRICYLIENEELRQTLGKNAFKKSHEFSIDIIMKKWIDLFNSLQAKQI
jgi:glycosyltransferase involved in cell wall biosynthesis